MHRYFAHLLLVIIWLNSQSGICCFRAVENDSVCDRYEFTERKLIGYKDAEGSIVIPAQYEVPDPDNLNPVDGYLIDDCRIIVKKNGKWGMINQDNQVLIPFQYDGLSRMVEGHLRFELNNHYGYLDSTGQIVLPAEYLTLDPYLPVEKIHSLKEEITQRLEQESKALVSREEAIEIAKDLDFFKEDHWLFPPEIVCVKHEEGLVWEINSMEMDYTDTDTEPEQHIFIIWINAQTGAVIKTEQEKFEIIKSD